MNLNKLPTPIVIRRPLITIAESISGGFILNQALEFIKYDSEEYYVYDHIVKGLMSPDSFDLVVTQLEQKGLLRSRVVDGYGSEYQLNSKELEKAIEAYKFSPLELGESIVINPNLVTIAGTIAGGIVLEELSTLNIYVGYESFEPSGMTLEEFYLTTQGLLSKSLVKANSPHKPPAYKLNQEGFDKAIEELGGQDG